MDDVADTADVKQLKETARQFGVDEDDVDILLCEGYCVDEIELMLNFPHEIRSAINEIDEMMCMQ
jgi:hypothetical protein